MWNISFDLDKEAFLYPDCPAKIEHFPLRRLLSTFDFINQCKLFETHDKSETFERNAQQLLKTVKDYKIAAVRIGDMLLGEVAPVFERINSTGRQLTIVDLMRAATWKGGFDLNDSISAVRDALEIKRFDEVPETHILRNISASSGFGIGKDDIEKLRDRTSEELKEAAAATVDAYRLAVDFISDELPLTSYAYMPYALQLTLLTEFFRICPAPSNVQRVALQRWFWNGALSRHFGTSNTGQNADDVAQIRKFARSEIHHLPCDWKPNYKGIGKDAFRLNKATSKGFALLLAANKPRNLLDGGLVNTYESLAVVNRHEYHHIFPRAFLLTSNIPIQEIDAQANICMINLGNNRSISDKRPSVYLKQVASQLGSDLEPVLKSHLISLDAFEAAVREDYYTFITCRSEQLSKQAELLCSSECASPVVESL